MRIAESLSGLLRSPFSGDGTSARLLACAFALYGLVAVGLLAVNIPPFQNVDEPTQFLRAAQLADGRLVGTRFTLAFSGGPERIWGGGPVDAALGTAFVPFDPVIFHPETKVTRSMWNPPVHWTNTRVPMVFPNTAVTPPLFYAPAALGIVIGRARDMPVVQTLTLSRLMTGVTAVTVAAAAIACAGGAAIWLFAILTLPMSLSLLASPAQDALLLACSALAGALLVRALRGPNDCNPALLSALTISLILVGTARPPYGALALLPLAVTAASCRARLIAAAAIAVGVLGWSGIAAATALTNAGDFLGADPAAQWAKLRDDPFLFPRAFWNTLNLYWPGYLEGFLGRPGWLDVALPPIYLRAAQWMLAIAAVAAALGIKGKPVGTGSRLVVIAGTLSAALGLFGIEYLTWTVPGNPTIDGIQGRYFLPLAMAGTALLPALGHTRLAALYRPLALAVAIFPVVSLAVVMRAVVLRYYLQ
jgi:uncharacterized membrane protein